MKLSGIAFLAAQCLLHAARPPFSPADLWTWRTAADARISPDGQWVVYVESRNDQQRDQTYANLRLVSSDGKNSWALTQGDWRDTSPRWSPDGDRIAWIAERGGKTQIRVRGRVGESDTVLAGLEQVPDGVAWSPAGDYLALVAWVPSAMAPPAWAPPSILGKLVRARQGHLQVFVVPVAGGTARQVSHGDFDCHGEPAWMADGKSIVASCDGQVYRFRVADGEATQLTTQGRNEAPMPSSDGSRIAWLASADDHQGYTPRKVSVMNADGSRVKVLSGSLDRDAACPQWSSDSRTVYFIADDRGATHVYAARGDGTVRQVTSAAERLAGFSLADNGRAVSVRTTASSGGDVFTFTVDRVSQPAVLAAPNEHLLAEREIAPAEEIGFSSEGNPIQGWMVKPPAFDSNRKYPLLLDIRDHPRTMYGVDFNLRAQVFAAAGFIVLCVNPRGSPGYGEVFGNLLPTRNPGDDYTDLMHAVDFVIGKGYIDTSRLTVAGGVLAAWTIGHTDRFRAAVAHHTTAGGPSRPWEDPDQYAKHAVIFFAQSFKTPTLVLSGEEEDDAGEELFAALQSRKVDSALVRLGKSPKPGDELAEWEVTLGWLRR